MDNASGQEQLADTFQVLPAHEPTPGKDASERAIFVASSLALAQADFLFSLIKDLRTGLLSTDLKQAASRTFSEKEFDGGVKELTCTSIYLMALEQGGVSSPNWLKSFLLLCFKASDLVISQPCAQEIMQTHEFLTMEDLLRETSLDTYHNLGFKGQIEPLTQKISSFIVSGKNIRARILELALTSELHQLQEKLASFQ